MSTRRIALLAVLIALASALFFTATYVLNRAIAVAGGHWAWSAALRYLLTLPMLALVLRMRGGFAPVWAALRVHPWVWLGWSAIGFTLFCVLLTWAADHAPAWLVAGTFQLTVIAGMLLGPLLYRDERARLPREAWLALLAVGTSAFLYPLGNRAILLHLERSGETLDATQRVFGMTLASQPFWLVVAVYAGVVAGAPSSSQVLLAAGVALSAGTIATILFFQATAMVKDDPGALGAVEAMQAAELIFSTVLGVVFLGEQVPRGWAALGALLVMLGIAGLGLLVGRRSAGDERATRALRTDRGA